MGPAKQQLRPRSGRLARKLMQLRLRLSPTEAKGGDLAWRSRLGTFAAEGGFLITGLGKSLQTSYLSVHKPCRESGRDFAFGRIH